MSLANMKIGLRLGFGFGIVLVLMVVMILVIFLVVSIGVRERRTEMAVLKVLGFRPRDAEARRVHRKELAGMRRDPEHRSSLATLRMLSAQNLYWSLGKSGSGRSTSVTMSASIVFRKASTGVRPRQ